MSTRYQFLPWVRQGATTAIRTVDTLNANVPARPALPLTLRVNQRVDVPVTLRLYGPGDVTGLDTRVVVRTDPPHLAAGFEPNYFPSIEFALPTLPWLLTPATGDGQGRLRPWLCLVVVRKQPGVTLTTDRQRPLPVLAIQPPARPAAELPDLAEAWAWAHGQVVSTDATPLDNLLPEGAGQSLSRLVCPRRLRPGQAYLACLVPAFAVGRKAGLGEQITPEEEGQLVAAWNLAEAPAALALPVYFHWEFSTGSEGDFESLVRRLHQRGQSVPEGVGKRSLHVGDAAFGLPDAGVLPLEGALRVPHDDPPTPVPPEFRDALQALLNRPEARRQEVDDEPLVAPPIYGSWQATQRQIDDDTPTWVREGNLDPRSRAAAGLGALVVQDQQEQLMASAWEQLGAPGHAQRRVHQQELGRAVLKKVHAGLAQLSPERFLHVTGPLHARVRLERPGVIFSGQPPEVEPRTAREQIRRSRLPLAVTSAPFRRVTRSRGPLLRRVSAAGTPAGRPLVFSAHFDQARTPPIVASALSSSDTVAAPAIDERIRHLIVLSTMLNEASQFNTAVGEVSAYLTAAVGGTEPAPQRPGLVIGQLQLAVLQQIDPVRSEGEAGADRAPRSLPGPSFPQPMYEALRDLAPEMLLPGIELIPPDSVMLLKTNPPVIEAYMIGLNHEMSRELLWREYPSDLRTTFFRRFWAGPAEMPEMHQWSADSPLGAQLAAGSGTQQVVLLLRGELLQRYPRTVIYAVPALDQRTPGTDKQYPIFRAVLAPDITCLGFDLSEAEVRGGEGQPGWFFVIEQPPGQARFGLDASSATGRDPAQLASWNDLAWGDMAASAEALEGLTHAPVAGQLLGRRIAAIEWGLNAAHMAAITLQRPVRVLLHAADLLPPTTST